MRRLLQGTGLALVIGTAALAEGHSGSKGYVRGDAGAKGYVHEARAAQHNHLIVRHRSEKRGSGELYTAPGCPPKFNGMWRGNFYCIDGRPID